MNFIAHFYLDRHHPESLFALGAATPDLLSIYNSGLRIKYGHIAKINPDELSEFDRLLMLGIARHFHADKLFHSCDFFKEETSFLTRMLENDLSGEDVPRKYFVAHVLLELILDKVLIQDHPEILSEYYAHYSKLTPFRELRLGTELISGKKLPNYENFLTKFTRNRYLSRYTEWEHIIYVMKRILRRVGIDDSDYLEKAAFTDIMQKYETRLKDIYPAVFDMMRKAPD